VSAGDGAEANGPSLLRRAWAALGEEAAELQRVHPDGEPPLSSALNVPGLARDAVAVASLAAAQWADHLSPRPDGRPRGVRLDGNRIFTAFTSERHLLVDGVTPDPWAPLSGFWQAADGWVRTHANYPHHRDRLLTALNLPPGTGPEAFAARVRSTAARQVEARTYAAGGIAVAVRDPGQGLTDWGGNPEAPPLTRTVLGPGPARFRGSAGTDPAAPLAGLRVLDLTRVIAGPVATRTLALLGADVLRIDSPAVPELPWQHLDTGAGKRSTLLDLSHSADRQRFRELLNDAHVVVAGYRPGALERFGLEPQMLARDHPGLVLARLSAWGGTGPWAGRRGFDSIVQAVTGISVLESADGTRPGALPAQALDHSAGYLLAGAVLSTLRLQQETGGTWLVETSLAGTAAELLRHTRAHRTGAAPGPPTTGTTPDGRLTTALPAPSYENGPDGWPSPARPWGGDPPRWRD
jgi:crotonobetainyl-CoA:carnitine CoA-transferase CaiB-like acyl-CoA transferase